MPRDYKSKTYTELRMLAKRYPKGSRERREVARELNRRRNGWLRLNAESSCLA